MMMQSKSGWPAVVLVGVCVSVPGLLVAFFGVGIPITPWAIALLILPVTVVTAFAAYWLSRLNRHHITNANRLAESDSFFANIIKNNVDGIALTDAELKVIYQSPAAEKISGFTAAEATGQNGFEFIHPDDQQRALKFFTDVLTSPGVSMQIHFRSRHKDGHYMWLEANVLNLLHSDEIKCVLITYRDITSHVEAEEKLKAQERRFRTMVENDFDAVVVLDTETRPVYRSPAAERIMGYTAEERALQPEFGFVYPEDMDMAREHWQKAIDSPGQPIHFVTRVVHKKGNIIWTENIITNLLNDPAIAGVVVNYRDITSRIEDENKLKQSEELYRAVVENSMDIVVLVDSSGKFKYRSPSAIKITGVSTEERLKQGLAMIHPQDLAMLLNERDVLIGASGQTFVRIMRVTDKEGKYIWMEVAITNLLHVPGVEAVVINARDITLHKKAEEDTKALNELLEKKVALRTEQLEAANKELEAFSYSVSHDLKAPLRVIEGYAKILSRPKNNLPEDLQRDLAVISENAIRMSHLINALLNFSRMGRAPLTKKLVDMQALVAAAVNELRTTDGPLAAEIVVGPLTSCECDQALVYRIWINLIHNAIKYSKRQQQPNIEIGMTTYNNQQVYFIKDNGVGFDMKNAERLFSVFQRLHKDSDFEGTGVGLALVNSIIKKHEGKIWVEAEVDKGATFYFTLTV